MSKTINSDLIRGNINTIILKSLYEGDRYGYDIIKEIEEKSHGQYILKQPTLYSCLKRLENQGFITAYWGEQTNGGRRKYYTLTEMGRQVFVQYQDEYEFSRTIIDQLISERDYDLNSIDHPATEKEENEEVFNAENDVEEVVTTPPQSNFDEEVTPIEKESIAVENEFAQSIHPELNDVPLQSSVTDLFDEILSSETKDSYSSTTPTSLQFGGVRIFEDRRSQKFEVQEQTYDIASTFEENEHEDDNKLPDSNAYEFSIQNESSDKEIALPNDSTPSQQNNFIAYNESIENNTNYNAPHTVKTTPFYKNILSELVEDFSSPTDTKPAQDKPTKDKIIAESNLSIKEKIQVRNFGKLTQSIQELGESAKIRTPNTQSVREYNKQYYYYRNKLRLYQYGIVFLIMLVECFLSYVIIKRGANVNTPSDIPIYVCSILFCLAFPISAGIIYLLEPFKRKRIDLNFKTSILFRIIVMVQLIVIIYAFNVYLGMPIGFSKEYALSTILPIILTTNIPLCGLIHRALYKSKIFAVEN